VKCGAEPDAGVLAEGDALADGGVDAVVAATGGAGGALVGATEATDTTGATGAGGAEDLAAAGTIDVAVLAAGLAHPASASPTPTRATPTVVVLMPVMFPPSEV